MADKPITEGEMQTIYLTPHCAKCIGVIHGDTDGILWCEDPQEPCEECGKDWIKYERAKRQK